MSFESLPFSPEYYIQQLQRAKERQASEEASFMRENVAILKEQARLEGKAAMYAGEQKREEGRLLTGKQQQLYARGGVSTIVGTPAVTMAEDVANIEREAKLFEIEGRQKMRLLESQAKLEGKKARSIYKAGMWEARMGTQFLTALLNESRAKPAISGSRIKEIPEQLYHVHYPLRRQPKWTWHKGAW